MKSNSVFVRRTASPTALSLFFVGIATLGLAIGGSADVTNTQPFPEVHYESEVRADPPQRIHIARINLFDPDVEVRVAAGGADPDGEGTYQTTLQTPSTIAERERFEVAVNGDFFEAKQTVDVEGKKSGYVTGKWALALGPAVTDGFLWAPAKTPRAALWFDALKRAHIAVIKDAPPEARQVIAGSTVLISDGQNIAETESVFSRTRHPRTAAGIADNGKTLVLVVVDGRRTGQASGMTLSELTTLLLALGCRDALNLDGGGSSELLMRDPQNGQLRVLNSPSDGRERAVANVLGVSIRGTRRLPNTAPALVPPTETP